MQPLAKMLENFQEAQHTSSDKLLNIILRLFYFSQDM